MKNITLGEPATEQFSVKMILNGETINEEKIHDPFITSITRMKRSGILKCLLKGRLELIVSVSGTPKIVDKIMKINPIEL